MDKDKELKYLNDERAKEIIWEVFLDYTSPTEISRKLYPELWDEHLKNYGKSSWSVPYVNKVIKEYKNFIFEKGIKKKIHQYNKDVLHEYPYSILLNTKLLLYYLKVHKKEDFKGDEKDIELLFNNKNIRNFIYEWMKTKDGFQKNVPEALLEFVFVFLNEYGEPQDENDDFLETYFKKRHDLLKKYNNLNIHRILVDINQQIKKGPSGLYKLRKVIEDINNKFICRW